jgi:SAM-dependent methyltransferase
MEEPASASRDSPVPDIGQFIAEIRASVYPADPKAREYFDLFANEAVFGFSIIENDLQALPPAADVLEIGAGIMLLSGYLARLGFRVRALEPIGTGFSHFEELQDAVRAHYHRIGLPLKCVASTIEEFPPRPAFDYAFSINVFEHIRDVELGLSNAFTSLRPAGVLRIYCPNYHFPYEPHFNIPTLLGKRLTERFFRSSIMNSPVPQASETWAGLNWINVARVRKLFSTRFRGQAPVFNRLATYSIIARALSDAHFSARRSRWMTVTLKAMKAVGLLDLFKAFPVSIAPVMDFRVRRSTENI